MLCVIVAIEHILSELKYGHSFAHFSSFVSMSLNNLYAEKQW